ncbi:hypothetical protein [Mycoplasmopsis cricetuli]|uniref:hypothetical protein n=1 Tax=Mycoplasmopsis cricetuli TaxID=171283 RepID=UPI000472F198|nr:hypothetical protein [Mycoplasmopsis cricetuli]
MEKQTNKKYINSNTILSRHFNKHDSQQNPNTPRFVYRVDTRPPEIIFREGFRNLGDIRNFFEHIVSTNFGQSWFVSFAETPTAAIRYFGSWLRPHVPTHPRVGYLYEVRADQYFYNARQTGESLLDLIYNDDVTYDEGDRDMANMGIRALRTSFSYQREWFSDGPVAATSVRSAWRIDAVPVAPGHASHPVGRVVETTRIHEPEILNQDYLDEETQANPNPWTPSAAMPVHLSVPEVFNVGDISEGVSGAFGFTCPDWGSNYESNSKFHNCIFEEYNYYKYTHMPHKTPSYKSEASDIELILSNKNNIAYEVFGKNIPNSYVSIFDISKKAELHALKSSNGDLVYHFYYDTQERITLKQNNFNSDLTFSLTPKQTDTAGVYKIVTQVSTNNHIEQKWILIPINEELTKFRVSSRIFPNIKNGLFRKKDATDHTLYLLPLDNSININDYEELFIEIDFKKTDATFITQRVCEKFFSDIALEWFVDNQYYTPLLSGWSKAGRSENYKFFYDFDTSVIFYVNEKAETFTLFNKRVSLFYDWDWVEWHKKSIKDSKTWEYKWYFSKRNLSSTSINNLNYRIIRSAKYNDYLKVIYGGSKWGGWYTTKYFNESNSVREFVLTDDFDK